MNCTAYAYYFIPMAKCMIAWSVKIINKCKVLLCTNSSQPGWFHVETYGTMQRVYEVFMIGLRSFARGASSRSCNEFVWFM